MQLRNTVPAIGAVLIAAILAMLGATWAASAIENRSAAAVRSKLLAEGITWVAVDSDGLQVRLTGIAPNEAARFRVVNLVGAVVQSSRIRDELDVTAMRAIEAPRFSVEMLRNDDGISLIGLVPGDGKDDGLSARVAGLAGGLPVSDMLEAADYAAPEGWAEVVDFGLSALAKLPRSKISVSADRVAITAISSSADEKRRLETELARAAPASIRLEMDISAPRPVLTPFILRFVIDEAGARFDACSADTEAASARILAAGRQAGAKGKLQCSVGLGVPSPRWAAAVEAGINAVATLGGGTLTFSDADVALLATTETPQALFDRTVGELQAKLPQVFSLTATLPPKRDPALQGPAEFTADYNDKGMVELRGRLTDELLRDAVESFARARFGADRVYVATRLDTDLPDGWPVRVLAGLESLALLSQGKLVVRADQVDLSGVTGNTEARDRISRILSERLGQGATFRIDVRYDEALDPLAALPTPQECVADLNAVMARQKITFAPGSAEVDGVARQVVDALAAVLADCPPLEMEISGHTDSQGSEGGNRALSQARAEAVLAALQGRRLPVQAFVAKGYGEERPIADNATEDGREANRRIEFTLLSEPEPAPAPSPVAEAEAAVAAQRAAAEAAAVADTDLAPETAAAQEAPDAQGAEDAADAEESDTTLTVAAANGADPVNGAVRSVTIPAAAEGAEETFVFVPVEESYPRPPRRP